MEILIADDHAVVRNGLKHILRSTYPDCQFTEAENGNQVIDLVHERKFDLLILDLSMPGANGLDVLRDLQGVTPELPVLVLSIHPEEQFAVRALKAGARGFLTKDAAADRLILAVSKILEGQKYVSESLAQKLASTFTDEAEQPSTAELSSREQAVMKYLYEGLPIKEIAARLELSPKTVSTYRQRILTKLNLDSNAALVQYLLKNNLV